MCTCETGRKLKERMKEHKDDGEKLRKDNKNNCSFTAFENHWPFPCMG